MPKYRKRPVEIDAIQWTGNNIDAVMGFMHPQQPVHVNSLSHMRFTNADDLIGIETLEGLMVADKGDWIIREPFPTDDRKFYPCKPDIFAATYEPVGDTPDTAEQEKTTRVFAALHHSAEEDVTRVINLYEQWVKAGPPPLGVSISRWWDARLVELHDAIRPSGQQTGCRCHNSDELCSGCRRCPDICHGCDGPDYQTPAQT
ncbi:hypothetical protein ACLQ2B_38095 [Streptomyces albogriseolus]